MKIYTTNKSNYHDIRPSHASLQKNYFFKLLFKITFLIIFNHEVKKYKMYECTKIQMYKNTNLIVIL